MKKSKTLIDVKNAEIDVGLTDEDVNARIKANLANEIATGSSRSILGIILKETFTYFNMIYMFITAILIFMGAYTQLTFLVVIIPNTLISIIQQIKSKRTIDKLSLLVKSKAKVIRNGKEVEVPINEVVRDDIIKYSLGDQICADCEVLQGRIKANESLLTGESVPIVKNAGDTLYGGSFITSGTCYARVVKVGMESYAQQLTAQAKKYKQPKSEILATLNSIIQIIGIAIIPISIFLYLRTHEVIKTAGAIIGMIPSGMFLLTTIALAVSVIRLSKNQTLVQELYCIEMLARVDTLCVDKTGTITDGTMKVDVVKSINNDNDERINEIIGNMLYSSKDDNATAKALNNHFTKQNSFITKKYYAFSSENKFFAVDFEKEGTYFLGAPEYVSDLSKYPKLKEEIENHLHLGRRTLLLSHSKDYNENSFDKATTTPIGLITLIDNVRQDAIDTISYFKNNNVTLKVISGDNEITVSEIAKRAGVEGASKYVSLQDKSDEEVASLANEYNIFGRVSPKQKEILVKALKKQKHTVAMVGDGVNDILALKEADCSVAIGAGSESAKNVSHLILVDSNFTHMQNVVSEGRRCINNLQGTSTMFLTKTFIAIILSAFCILTAFNYPFSPNQLMVLELFAIGIPGFFFALQPNTKIVKGKFLDSVITKSVSQALTALLFILPLYILMWAEGFEPAIVETLIVLIVTSNSIIVLYRISYPFNKFRLIVCITMTILAILAFLLFSNVSGLSLLGGTIFGNYLGLSKLSQSAFIIFIIILLSLLPMQIALSKFSNFLITKRQKKVKTNHN